MSSSRAKRGQGGDFDAVVVGGGATAAAMASLLTARGLAAPGRIAMVAAEVPASTVPAIPESAWDLRVYALGRAAQRLLMLCGAWAGLTPDKRCAYERMCVWEGASQAAALKFDCAELNEPNLGHIVEGRALTAQCRLAASTAGVICIEASIAAIDADLDHVRIRLGDGRQLQCALLIAADGAESPTRRMLGIETAGHAYHQDALVAHVRTATPHQYTAWQRFLPTGPLAFLPMPDGRSSLVWSAQRAEATRLRALDSAAFGAALTAASGEVLGACELTTPLASFPLRLQYAADYVRPRAVLVGDAAHTVHPLAGQGLNLGFLDCAALVEVLAESGAAPRDLGEARALRRYERRRRSEILFAATALDGLERLFSSSNPALAAIRAAGLGAAGRFRFVRRELASRALGLTGDIPAFLRTDP